MSQYPQGQISIAYGNSQQEFDFPQYESSLAEKVGKMTCNF